MSKQLDLTRKHLPNIPHENGRKFCTACRQWVVLTGYSVNRQSWDGLRPDCKTCANKKRRAKAHARGIPPRAVIRTATTKRCCTCKQWLPYSTFGIDNSSKDGFSQRCLACAAAQTRAYASKHLGLYTRQSKAKYHGSIQARLRQLCKNRIWWALKGVTPKSTSTMELIGCTPDELKIHLESKFEAGMTWDNYGYRGWHMGHIKDCCMFDLTDPEQQRQCFHFTNLKPQWATDNWRQNRGIGKRKFKPRKE